MKNFFVWTKTFPPRMSNFPNSKFPSQNASSLLECLLYLQLKFLIIKSIGINIPKFETNSFIYSIKSLLLLRISKFDILNYYRVLSCYYLLYWHVHITLFNFVQRIMKMCFWAFVPLYILFVRVNVFHHLFWLYNKCVIMNVW